MADINYELSIMTLVIPYLLERRTQIGRKAPLFSMLRKRPGSGKVASDVIEVGGATITNTAEGADAPDASINNELPYSFNFGSYDSAMKITEQARRASGTVSGPPTGTGSYTAKEAQEFSTRVVQVIEDIERDFWDGSGVNEIISLYDAIGDTTNTYGGINRATLGNEYWHPNVFDDGVPTTPTMALIEEDLTAIRANAYKPGQPDLCVVSPKVFQAVKSSLNGNITYNVGAFAPNGIQTVGVQYGLEKIAVGSTMIFVDDYAKDTDIAYINSDHAFIEYMPYPQGALMAMDAAITPEILAATRRALVEAKMDGQLMPLDMLAKKLGATGSHDKIMVQCFPQLVVARPNSCGMRLNISV